MIVSPAATRSSLLRAGGWALFALVICLRAPAQDVVLQPFDPTLSVVAVPPRPTAAETATARRLLQHKQIVRLDGVTPAQMQEILGARIPLVSALKQDGLVLRTIGVRAAEGGSFHVFYGYSRAGSPADHSWNDDFDRWAEREAVAAGKPYLASVPASAPERAASPRLVAAAAGSPAAATSRKLLDQQPNSAWTEVAQVLQTGSTPNGNKASLTVRVYRLNSSDTLHDYYMVLYGTETIPNYAGLPGTSSGWATSLREISAALTYGASGGTAELVDHGPTGTITTETTGFSIGATLGATAAGPTGGVTATYSQTWSTPSVVTGDKTTTSVATWEELFTDQSAGTATGTYISYQGAIFRVPIATPKLVLNASVYTNWSIFQDKMTVAASIEFSPPEFSVTPTTMLIPAGGSATVQVNASIKSDSGLQLGWAATQTGGNWFSVGPTSGAGPCSVSAGTCPQVTVNPGTADGQVGFVQFNTNPPGGTPSVAAGPLVVKVVVGQLADTVTTLAANPSTTSVLSPVVTLTATVSSDKDVPSGTVTFFDSATAMADPGPDGATALGQPAPVVNGRATLAYTFPFDESGRHTITAKYSGDLTHAQSTSAPLVLWVTGPDPSNFPIDQVSISPPTIQWPNTAAVSGRIALGASSSIPFESDITLVVDGVRTKNAAPARSNSGAGVMPFAVTLSTANLAVGTHALAIHYAGDWESFEFTSPTLVNFVVSPADVSLTNSASAMTAFVGDSVTFTARALITSPHPNYPDFPDGAVVFSENGKTLGSATLRNGIATFTTTTLTAGPHSIQASFTGAAYTSPTAQASVTMMPNDVAAEVFASPANPVYGQPVSFQTQVTRKSQSTNTPTGTVTFRDGNVTLFTVNLEGTSATLANYTQLTGGTHSITAIYNGDGVFTPVTSPPLALTVTPAASNTTLTVSQPSPAVYGEFLDLNVVLTDRAGTVLAEAEQGTVSFSAVNSQGTKVLGTQPLSNGKASLRVTNLAAGEYNFTATWSGSSNYSLSTSNQQAFAVSTAGTRTEITGPPAGQSYEVGDTVTVTVRVSVTPPGGGAIMNDTVVVSDPNFPDSTCSAPLQGTTSPFTGSCSFVLKAAGNRQLVAYYRAADANYSPSQSTPAVPITVNPDIAVTDFTNLTPSQSVPYGTAAVSLAGVISAPGPVYPPAGDKVTITVGAASQQVDIGVNGAFGTAAFPISGLGSDQYTITYTYAGSVNFTPRTNSSTTLTIANAQPVFSQLSQNVVVAPGASTVSLAGVIAAPGPLYPPVGEKITITVGGVSQDVPLGANGTFATASFPVASLGSAGSPYTITYRYAGNANFHSSADTSTVLRVVAPSVSVIVSATPATALPGQPVLVTFAVRPAAGAGTPTGTVQITGVPEGSCSASVAAGSCSITFTSVGTKTLTATYSGDGAFAPSTSPPASVTVFTKFPTVATLTSAPNPAALNAPVTFTVRVTSPAGGIPSGNVTLVEHIGQTVAVLAQGNLDANGVVTFAVNSLKEGAHEIDATYGGDSRYQAATSNAVNQQITPP